MKTKQRAYHRQLRLLSGLKFCWANAEVQTQRHQASANYCPTCVTPLYQDSRKACLLGRGRDAAEREVKEETGVDAEFRAVLAIRQSHGFLHGKSDLFFGVALQCVPTVHCLSVQRSAQTVLCRNLSWLTPRLCQNLQSLRIG